jgi:hypothetical protein
MTGSVCVVLAVPRRNRLGYYFPCCKKHIRGGRRKEGEGEKRDGEEKNK